MLLIVLVVAYLHLVKAALTSFFFPRIGDKVPFSAVFRVALEFSFLKDGWQAVFSFIWEWKVAAAISCVFLLCLIQAKILGKTGNYVCSIITSLFLKKSCMFCILVRFTQWPLINPTWDLCALHSDCSGLCVRKHSSGCSA